VTADSCGLSSIADSFTGIHVTERYGRKHGLTLVRERLADDDVIAEVLEPDGCHLVDGATKCSQNNNFPEKVFHVT
jgi:hypothetical protein